VRHLKVRPRSARRLLHAVAFVVAADDLCDHVRVWIGHRPASAGLAALFFFFGAALGLGQRPEDRARMGFMARDFFARLKRGQNLGIFRGFRLGRGLRCDVFFRLGGVVHFGHGLFHMDGSRGRCGSRCHGRLNDNGRCLNLNDRRVFDDHFDGGGHDGSYVLLDFSLRSRFLGGGLLGSDRLFLGGVGLALCGGLLQILDLLFLALLLGLFAFAALGNDTVDRARVVNVLD
jgi:hypothetical protein